MTHPVEMFSMRMDLLSDNSRVKHGGVCSRCGVEVEMTVDESDGIDPVERIAKELSARGCEHWKEPFIDVGNWFDPRTEHSRLEDSDGVKGEIYGFCPTQGKGTVDGLPWYYRWRHGSGRFAIGISTEVDPADIGWPDGPDGWIWHFDDGEPVGEAWTIVRRCVVEWRADGGSSSTKNLAVP